MPDLSHAIPLLPWSAILETLEKMRPTPEQLSEVGPENRTMLPPLSLEQLEHPTPDFVRRVLSFLIEELLTVSGCDISQPVFEAIDQLPFPELYDKAMPVLNLYDFLNSLVEASCCKPVSAKDLMNPEEGWLRQLLSGIVNFAFLRERKLEEYEGWHCDVAEQETSLADLQEANTAARAAVEAKALQLADDHRELQRLSDEADSVRRGNFVKTEVMNAAHAEYQAAKADAQAAVAAREGAAVEAQLAADELAQVKQLLVQSPDELRAALEEIRAAVAADAAEGVTYDEDARETGRRMHAATQGAKEIEARIEALDVLATDAAAAAAAAKSVEALQAQVAAMEHLADLQLVERQAAARRHEELQSKLASFNSQNALLMAAKKAEVEERQSQVDAADAAIAAERATRAQNDYQIHGLQRQIDEQQEAHNARMLAQQKQYHSLLSQVDEYHARLREVMT